MCTVSSQLGLHNFNENKMTDKKKKFCINCKWYSTIKKSSFSEKTYAVQLCLHENNFNLVTGEAGRREPKGLRAYDDIDCSPLGKWYEED